MDSTSNELWFDSWEGCFSFRQSARTGLGACPVFHSMDNGALSPEIIRPKRETNVYKFRLAPSIRMDGFMAVCLHMLVRPE